MCVQRKREREKEREDKERENKGVFHFFFQKNELPKKFKNKFKKMPWDQGPGLRCPGDLVPGFPSKVVQVLLQVLVTVGKVLEVLEE